MQYLNHFFLKQKKTRNHLNYYNYSYINTLLTIISTAISCHYIYMYKYIHIWESYNKTHSAERSGYFGIVCGMIHVHFSDGASCMSATAVAIPMGDMGDIPPDRYTIYIYMLCIYSIFIYVYIYIYYIYMLSIYTIYILYIYPPVN